MLRRSEVISLKKIGSNSHLFLKPNTFLDAILVPSEFFASGLKNASLIENPVGASIFAKQKYRAIDQFDFAQGRY
jgi:hypothetical protein